MSKLLTIDEVLAELYKCKEKLEKCGMDMKPKKMKKAEKVEYNKHGQWKMSACKMDNATTMAGSYSSAETL